MTTFGMPVDVTRDMMAKAATRAQSVAEVHGYQVPQDVKDTYAALRELDVIERSPLPANQPSTDPKKLRQSLAGIAAEARSHSDMLAAAREARPLLVSRQVQAVRAAIPEWSQQLASEWDSTWAEFAAIAPQAPADVNQWTSDAAASAHVKALRLASVLDDLLLHRIWLGGAAGEDPPAVGPILFVMGVPVVPENPNAVEPEWQRYGGLIDSWSAGGVRLTTGTRQALEGRALWESLLGVAGLDVGMVPVGSGALRARILQVNAWQQAIGTLHSLGGLAAFRMLDRRGGAVAML